MKKTTDNLIVIPAYNEEKYIARVVRDAAAYADVLVVDDGSTDATSELAEQAGAFCLRLRDNMGVTYALQSGVRWGLKRDYDTCIFMDADGAHDPSYISTLVTHHSLARNDLTIAARADFRSLEPSLITSTKYLANYFATTLTNLILGTDYVDVASGYRVLNPLVMEQLLGEGRGFGGMYEMLRRATLEKLQVGYFLYAPVRYDAREPLHTSQLELLDFLQVLSRWASEEPDASIRVLLEKLSEVVKKEVPCTILLKKNLICLIPTVPGFFAFQLQSPYFFSKDELVLDFG